MSKAAFIRSLLQPDIWLSVRDLFEMAVYADESIEYCDVNVCVTRMAKSGILHWRVNTVDPRSTQYRLKCPTLPHQ